MADVKYAISIKDGRLVYATNEVAQNPSFFVLHPETVLAIQKGTLTAEEVLVFIKNRSRTPEEIAQLRPENVRQTVLAKPEPSVTSAKGIKVPVATSTATVAVGSVADALPDGVTGVPGVDSEPGIPSKSKMAAMKVDDLRALAVSAGKDVTGLTKTDIIDALTGAAV